MHGSGRGVSGVTAVAGGWFHSLALKGDGRVLAWGCRGRGQVGPCNTPAGLTGVTAIAAGTEQSLALTAGGSVLAWGCASGTSSKCSVPAGRCAVTAIAAGA